MIVNGMHCTKQTTFSIPGTVRMYDGSKRIWVLALESAVTVVAE